MYIEIYKIKNRKIKEKQIRDRKVYSKSQKQ